MSKRNRFEIICVCCGAELVSKALYDEFAEVYFCDGDCYEEWADHTQSPAEYYREHNVREIEFDG